MSDTPALIVRKSGAGTTQLQLNREHVSNALNEDLVERLIEAVIRCYEDGSTLLVLRGSGRNFCSGFDRGASRDEGTARAVQATRIETLLQLLWDAPFATLCLVQGKAIGAGADLAAACDFRWGAPGSTYSFPGFHLFGVSLGNRRLAQLVGGKAAFALVLRAKVLDVDAAWRCNLVTEIVPPEDLESALAALQEELSAVNPHQLAQLRGTTCT